MTPATVVFVPSLLRVVEPSLLEIFPDCVSINSPFLFVTDVLPVSFSIVPLIVVSVPLFVTKTLPVLFSTLPAITTLFTAFSIVTFPLLLLTLPVSVISNPESPFAIRFIFPLPEF